MAQKNCASVSAVEVDIVSEHEIEQVGTEEPSQIDQTTQSG